jgi:hypothetical protein
MRREFCVALLLSAVGSVSAAGGASAGPDAPGFSHRSDGPYMGLDPQRTSRNSPVEQLLAEQHRQTVGLAMLRSTWPAPCGADPLWQPACPSAGSLTWSGDDARDEELPGHRRARRGVQRELPWLSLRPLLATEVRYLEQDAFGTGGFGLSAGPADTGAAALLPGANRGTDRVQTYEGGVQLIGQRGRFTFELDARLFVEDHSAEAPRSYDGEYVERSQEGDESVASFMSFSRYRGSANLDLAFGRLAWRRGSVHWGPARWHALTFNQSSAPFDQWVYEGTIGPFRVTSLVGDLAIDGWGAWRSNAEDRTLYAHRYEWLIHPALQVGISEQLLVYKDVAPWAFIPVVPLFMAKGQLREENNNGNLSFDAQWRVVSGLRLYGEFLVDDVSEPASLFNDYWKNRWAATLGAHVALEAANVPVGLQTEWARIEPWVYTHYRPLTAQAAHHGAPLGDPMGPDAMAVTTQLYARPGPWFVAVGADWRWLGGQPGSSVADYLSPTDDSRKVFLAGVDQSEWTLRPEVGWNRGPWSAVFRFDWGRSSTQADARLAVMW